MREREIPNDYQKVVEDIVKDVDPGSREAVLGVLGSEKAIEAYGLMKEQGMSKGEIYRIMKHGIQDLAHDGKISTRSLMGAVAEELAQYQKYLGVIDAMRDDGLLSEHQREEILREMGYRIDSRSSYIRKGLEGLASKAAVWVFAIGALLVLLSAASLTGAVIGFSPVRTSGIFILGLALIFIAWLLNKK
ncbi:hypothetical protein D6817_02850 [Candidatus Pacearchaeota archaeon]|nr:MAG: hypothetical protein D6817_02850 [Candidatus Pacearchaeota archaeon]